MRTGRTPPSGGAAAALAAVLVLTMLPAPAGAQSVIPVVEMALEPVNQEVDASSAAAQAVFNGYLFVEGLPLVRYRVNLTADCEGWEAACNPGLITVTGSANNSFTATVTVPAGVPGGLLKQLTVNATVTTSGLPLTTCSTYAVVSTRQSFGVKLSSDASGLTVSAGKTVSWPFALRNTGNGPDSFQLQVVDLQTYSGSGWNPLPKFNRTYLSIAAGETGYAQVNITPPNGSKNQTIQFEISAYSRGAKFQNITAEDKLALSLTIVEVPGGGRKPATAPRATPGPGLPALAAAAALAALLCVWRRK